MTLPLSIILTLLLPAGVAGAQEAAMAQPGWDSLAQVRIEERVTIRVNPAPRRTALLFARPAEERPHMVEQRIGKCLPTSSIVGMKPEADNRLVLFTRNHQMISATLERSCRARDYYSGFYLARSGDGKLCVDRDVLLSRSGANCKVTRIRRLVERD